jgi:hypothetical protein
MSDEDPRLAMIRANADLVVSELGPLSGIDFGYNAASVGWVDGYIERQRERLDNPETAQNLVSVIGSYLGEAIIRTAGGAWGVHERDELGVVFASGDWCFPFSKVAKQIAHGAAEGNSVSSFYNVSVGLVASGRLGGVQAGGDADPATSTHGGDEPSSGGEA